MIDLYDNPLVIVKRSGATVHQTLGNAAKTQALKVITSPA